MEEVAGLEGVKHNSMRVKLAETKKRFGVHTTTHLTALAIRRKLMIASSDGHCSYNGCGAPTGPKHTRN